MSSESLSREIWTISETVGVAVSQNRHESENLLTAISSLKEKCSMDGLQFSEEIIDGVVRKKLLTNLFLILTQGIDCQRQMQFIDNSSLENRSLNLINDICIIVKSFAVHSVKISVEISKSTDFLNAVANVLEDLKTDLLKQTLFKEVYTFIYNLISLCFNIVLHDKSEISHQFRAIKFVEIIAPYLKSADCKPHVTMLLIYLVSEDEATKYLDEAILKVPLEYLKKIINNHFNALGPISKSTVLQAVLRLSCMDAFRNQLVDLGILDYLISFIQSDDNDDAEKALNILGQLAFSDQNMQRLKDKNLDSLIRPLIDQAKPLALQKEARGILWNMEDGENAQGKNQGTSATSEQQAKDGSSKHVMISYQWDHQETIKKIKDRLIARKEKVWLDIDHMNQDLYSSMGEAVENAWLVLVCYSNKYKDSYNCRLEAQYATQKRKEIIPLRMENYDPDGWLGIITAGKVYHDFSDESRFDVNVKKLLDGISNLKATIE